MRFISDNEHFDIEIDSLEDFYLLLKYVRTEDLPGYTTLKINLEDRQVELKFDGYDWH